MDTNSLEVHLYRSEDTIHAESVKFMDYAPAFIRKVINLFSAAEIKRDLWLTEREKDFYVAMVIHVSQGIENPSSDEAIQIYKDYFTPEVNKRVISDYTNRISKKKWASYNRVKKKIEIPSLFLDMDLEKQHAEFKIELHYEINRQDMERAWLPG